MKKSSFITRLSILLASVVAIGGITFGVRYEYKEANAWSGNQTSTAPANYYSSCEGKEGSALQAELLSINKWNSKSYNWSRYEAADEAENDSSSIISIYTRHNIKKNAHVGSSYSWDTWNREHVWTQTAYPNSKTDMFAMFMETGFVKETGFTAMINMHSWMFLSSFEKLRVSLLESKEIVTKIIHVGVGDISEADVMLAAASNALILGFTVKEDSNALAAAEREGVTIKKYDIIYQILEDIEQTMISLLSPEIKEIVTGQAEVRQIFTIGKTIKIAGCYVTEGKINRNDTATITRAGAEIFKGSIDQLKRFKDDVKEVAQGFECGISFVKFNDVQEGDIIKFTTTKEIEKTELE